MVPSSLMFNRRCDEGPVKVTKVVAGVEAVGVKGTKIFTELLLKQFLKSN